MPSGPVILDPQELRRFASQLKQFNTELSSNMARLHGQFTQLGDTWRDPAYAKFAQEFRQTMRNLERFRQVADAVIPQLQQTAERGDNVHR